MKLFKRFAAVLTAAVITVSALAVTVFADNIFDSASSISAGKKYSGNMSGTKSFSYKIKTESKGTLKISINSDVNCYMYVYDTDGTEIKPSKTNLTTGNLSSISLIQRNSNTGLAKGTVEYSIKAGTYYIQFKGTYLSGKFSFSVKTPDDSGDDKTSKTSGDCFIIYMDEGDKIQLGSIFGGKEEKATWKSSKTSVAKVSSNGKITAVSEGEAEITAKKGSKTIKIKVIVDD